MTAGVHTKQRSPGHGAGQAALLLLADGRLPSGGHAHSGGLEEAVATRRVSDTATLATFLAGRLATTGCTEAALAAAAWTRASPEMSPAIWMELDAEGGARIASPALRRASRAQGRGLLRSGRRMWPHPALETLMAAIGAGPLWPVAFGATGAAAGLRAEQVTLAVVHAVVSGPAWAATRLMGLDPYAVAAVIADLGAELEARAGEAAAWADPAIDLRTLPALGAPLADIGAENHAAWEVRLFAS